MEFKDNGLSNNITKEQLAHMTDEQIEEMATVYSEGNPGLKELLIYCSKNQIPTFASCGGHPDRQDNSPYIGFILDDSSTELFSRIFPEILKSNRSVSISSFDTLSRLTIYVDKENPEIAFQNLRNTIEQFKQFPQNENFNRLSYIIQHACGNVDFDLIGDPNGEISKIEFIGSSNQLGLKKMPREFSSSLNNVFQFSENIDNVLDTIIENMEISDEKEIINLENKALENLLQYCSEHEISVLTSRGVTINGKADRNFIAFDLNDNDKGILSKLFLMQLYENSEMRLWKHEDEMRFAVYLKDANIEPQFAQIQNCFEDYEKNAPTYDNLFEKITSSIKNNSNDLHFTINGLLYAKDQNLPLLLPDENKGLEPPTPINEYSSNTSINPYEIINEEFDDFIQSLENSEEEHIEEKNVESSLGDDKLTNIKDFCKKVPYNLMGMNILSSFIPKVRNLGKTKDNERSKPWTR